MLHRRGLKPVADSQNRNIQIKDQLRRARRPFFGNGFRTARKDDATRAKLFDKLRVNIPGINFTVDARLSNTSCDELRILRTKVENKDAFLSHGVPLLRVMMVLKRDRRLGSVVRCFFGHRDVVNVAFAHSRCTDLLKLGRLLKRCKIR